MTQIQTSVTETSRYAQCLANSNRIHWDIDNDVIRGRRFDFEKKFLPDGLSMVNELEFLTEQEKRFLSHVQGRTYANMFGLVERFICAKVMEVSHGHALGDQTALAALVNFSTEELKHQELFRRLETMTGEQMPAGYRFLPQPNEVASAVLGKSNWAVLALTLHIELFTQVHYLESIEPDDNLSELWKDVFLFHWKEESQHAILDELEWVREDKKLSAQQRDRAVAELIELVGAIDGILQLQAKQDAEYFIANGTRAFASKELELVSATMLRAYRRQYIVSGLQVPRFRKVLASLITPAQGRRIASALVPIL